MSILKFLSFLALEVVFKSLRCGKGFQLLFQFYRFFVNLKYLSFLLSLSLPPLPLSLSLSHIQLLALESNKIFGICLKVTCWHGKSINNFFLVNPNFFLRKNLYLLFLYIFDNVKLNVKLKVFGIELLGKTYHDCLAKLILYNRINYHSLNIHMHQKMCTCYRWVDAQCNVLNGIVSIIVVYLEVHVQGKFIIDYY